ncbi:DNA-binding response regulator [Erwinia rhapontici]|nr:DNA-binding response regulator [Erwinia rhapontici]
MTLLTVYLIDDDSAIRESFTLLLETMGWQVAAFASAGEFIAMQQHSAELHGCILLDIRMPGKTGLTLLDELQQQAVLLPVILMTGHGNIETCRRAFKNGAFEFLTKPVDADLLIETVSAAFSQYEKRYQLSVQRRELAEKFSQLSDREAEVMQQMVAGQANKEIAQTLGYRRAPLKRIARIFSASWIFLPWHSWLKRLKCLTFCVRTR